VNPAGGTAEEQDTSLRGAGPAPGPPTGGRRSDAGSTLVARRSVEMNARPPDDAGEVLEATVAWKMSRRSVELEGKPEAGVRDTHRAPPPGGANPGAIRMAHSKRKGDPFKEDLLVIHSSDAVGASEMTVSGGRSKLSQATRNNKAVAPPSSPGPAHSPAGPAAETRRSSLGGRRSSLGDRRSSLGDRRSSLGEQKSRLSKMASLESPASRRTSGPQAPARMHTEPRPSHEAPADGQGL